MLVGSSSLHRRHPLFGQILLSQGKITVEQLDVALSQQAKTKIYLGEVLCRMELVTPADVAEALHIQRNYYPEEGES
jgi:hypothetical protein